MNNDAYSQIETAITVAGDFTNNGAVTESGQYLFSGQTNNNSAVTGDGPDSPIVLFDTSPTGDQIFDINNGTVTNVVREPVNPQEPGACSTTPPTTTTTTTLPTTTTRPSYVGLTTTGGSPVDGSLAAAIALTLSGLALTLIARTRRQ
jgi:hypothetical protein